MDKIKLSFPKNIVDQAVPISVLKNIKSDVEKFLNDSYSFDEVKETINIVSFKRSPFNKNCWFFKYTTMVFLIINNRFFIRKASENTFELDETKFTTFKNIVKFLKKKGYISLRNGDFLHKYEFKLILEAADKYDIKNLISISNEKGLMNKLMIRLPYLSNALTISLHNKQITDILNEYIHVFYPIIKKQQNRMRNTYYEYLRNKTFLDSLPGDTISTCELYKEIHKK